MRFGERPIQTPYGRQHPIQDSNHQQENASVWIGGIGEIKKTNGGPNVVEYNFNTDEIMYAWTTSSEVNAAKGKREWGRILHNTSGPARVTNCKTVKYFLHGEEKTLTQFKREYLITHLEVYNKPTDLVELCNR